MTHKVVKMNFFHSKIIWLLLSREKVELEVKDRPFYLACPERYFRTIQIRFLPLLELVFVRFYRPTKNLLLFVNIVQTRNI